MNIQEAQARRLAAIQASPEQFNADDLAWAASIAPVLAAAGVVAEQAQTQADQAKAGS